MICNMYIVFLDISISHIPLPLYFPSCHVIGSAKETHLAHLGCLFNTAVDHTSNLGFQLDSIAAMGSKVRERKGA